MGSKASVMSRRLVVFAVLAFAMVIVPVVTSVPSGIDHSFCLLYTSDAADE